MGRVTVFIYNVYKWGLKLLTLRTSLVWDILTSKWTRMRFESILLSATIRSNISYSETRMARSFSAPVLQQVFESNRSPCKEFDQNEFELRVTCPSLVGSCTGRLLPASESSGSLTAAQSGLTAAPAGRVCGRRKNTLVDLAGMQLDACLRLSTCRNIFGGNHAAYWNNSLL